MAQPIGIFDSGIGGLTVLKEIHRLLPHEPLIYLGDTARVPYGTKSPSTVVRYAKQNASFFDNQGVKALVVACNTASAHALGALQNGFNFPVLGVIEPGVREALSLTPPGGGIGVIGTEGTIQSRAYQRLLISNRPDQNVVQCATPLLVPLVEEGLFDAPITEQVLRLYLDPFIHDHAFQTLILGCTHYPLLKGAIQRLCGKDIRIIDSAQATAQALAELLRKEGLANSEDQGGIRYYSTDSPERMERIGRLFLGEQMTSIEQIDVV